MISPVHLFLSDLNQGGFLMPAIFTVSIIAWMIGIKKYFLLRNILKARKIFLHQARTIIVPDSQLSFKRTGFENYDYLLRQLHHSAANNGIGGKGHIREFLIGTIPLLNRNFSTMSAWISIAPLLGLLGTVMGMIQTFIVIMNFGIGNPNLTAEGISIALLTTQAGLTVAFPALIFHNFLINRKDMLMTHIFNDFEQLIKQISPNPLATGAADV